MVVLLVGWGPVVPDADHRGRLPLSAPVARGSRGDAARTADGQRSASAGAEGRTDTGPKPPEESFMSTPTPVRELSTLRHVTLDIGGMTCASCVAGSRRR